MQRPQHECSSGRSTRMTHALFCCQQCVNDEAGKIRLWLALQFLCVCVETQQYCSHSVSRFGSGWVQANHGSDAVPVGWTHFQNDDDDDDICKDGWPCASAMFYQRWCLAKFALLLEDFRKLIWCSAVAVFGLQPLACNWCRDLEAT